MTRKWSDIRAAKGAEPRIALALQVADHAPYAAIVKTRPAPTPEIVYVTLEIGVGAEHQQEVIDELVKFGAVLHPDGTWPAGKPQGQSEATATAEVKRVLVDVFEGAKNAPLSR